MMARRQVSQHVFTLLLASLACCGGSTDSTDASTTDASLSRFDASSEAASTDARADAAACSALPLNCGCKQPLGSCCAEVSALPPTCKFGLAGTTCLPDCFVDSIQCSAQSGPLNALRPTCNSPSDCTAYAGYPSCCTLVCSPSRVSVCLSPSEAQAQGLTCL